MNRLSEKLSSEIKEKTISIYEENKVDAPESSRHEILDYAINKVIEPYREVTNRLISLVNERAFNRKREAN